jgi:hypothetical protein
MSAIGEKQGEFTGTITSVTITETDAVVTFEEDTLGLVLGTATFGRAIDPEGETGPFTVHAKVLLSEGGILSVRGTGAWRKTGPQQWEEKAILLGNGGERFFVVDEFDLAARTTKGVYYALD